MEMRWEDLVVCYVRKEKSIQGFGRMAAGGRRLGRPIHRYENNNKMDLNVIGWEGMD
jgi:hypothetical protein